MHLHEYQAKELLARRGVIVPVGAVVSSPPEARAAAERLAASGVNRLVVKAQIHGGGRGTGAFTNGHGSGVRFCATAAEVEQAANTMLGGVLVTQQTGPQGRRVSRLLIEAELEVEQELYVAVLLDRAVNCPVLIACGEGGVNVERLIEAGAGHLVRESVDPLLGLRPYQARRAAEALGLTGARLGPASQFLQCVYRTWWECEASLVEVNPMGCIAGNDGRSTFIAVDARIALDDSALFRHADLEALRDTDEEAAVETEARKHGLDYIKLGGDIACLVNGAGLAMATMDTIKQCGGLPANFLDVGGGATQEQVTAAFRTILKDTNVRAILVNIFGGITDCDVVARGVAAAVRDSGVKLPVVVRVEGNNAARGRRTLAEALSGVIVADSIVGAAEEAVRVARDNLH